MVRSNSSFNLASNIPDVVKPTLGSISNSLKEGEAQATIKTCLLVIDDDAADRALVNAMVDTKRYTIMEAETGIQGLEIAAENNIDCVLLDYNLPDMNGTEMFHRLRNVTKNASLPVILFTGQGDEALAVKAMQDGASDYLPKNKVSPSSLARVLFNAIKHGSLSRSLHEERKRILSMNQELRRANDEISSFYQTVSHELKTPLMAIREFTSITLDEISGPINKRQREYLTRSMNCCDRLTSMINDLMDTALIETGKLTLEFNASSINTLIEDCIVELSGRAKEANVSIETQLEPELLSVSCDERRVRQVISNLITNALKFTRSGGSILVTSWLDGSSDIFVSIQDTGRGIEPEFHNTIFERFAQARTEDADFQKGMGIGLYLCASIVERHGGRIKVDSQAGVGSTFTFNIPV